jgi:hypothetical protein
MKMILPVLGFLILCTGVLVRGDATTDSFPKLDYETLSRNNFDFLKKNELIVVAVGKTLIKFP